MEELHAWLARQFEGRLVEPNSVLGGAISYLLKHWEKLTLFLPWGLWLCQILYGLRPVGTS